MMVRLQQTALLSFTHALWPQAPVAMADTGVQRRSSGELKHVPLCHAIEGPGATTHQPNIMCARRSRCSGATARRPTPLQRGRQGDMSCNFSHARCHQQ